MIVFFASSEKRAGSCGWPLPSSPVVAEALRLGAPAAQRVLLEAVRVLEAEPVALFPVQHSGGGILAAPVQVPRRRHFHVPNLDPKPSVTSLYPLERADRSHLRLTARGNCPGPDMAFLIQHSRSHGIASTRFQKQKHCSTRDTAYPVNDNNKYGERIAVHWPLVAVYGDEVGAADFDRSLLAFCQRVWQVGGRWR